MNQANEIHWDVFELRGLAVASHYGLGMNWRPLHGKMASVSDKDAKAGQTATRDRQENQSQAKEIMAKAQDLEKRDLAVGRPPAGASVPGTDAPPEALGEAA